MCVRACVLNGSLRRVRIVRRKNRMKINQQSEINIDFSIMLSARICLLLLHNTGKSYIADGSASAVATIKEKQK